MALRLLILVAATGLASLWGYFVAAISTKRGWKPRSSSSLAAAVPFIVAVLAWLAISSFWPKEREGLPVAMMSLGPLAAQYVCSKAAGYAFNEGRDEGARLITLNLSDRDGEQHR